MSDKKAAVDTVNDFSKGGIMKTILKLAVPMTLAQLINLLYNVIDRMYIGHMGSGAPDALTGVGVCLPVITMITAFSNLVGMGAAPLVSIERGRNNGEEAEKILGNSLTLLLILGVALTALGLLIKDPMLRALGASENIFPYADEYISIYLLGTIFVMLSLGLNSIINAQGFGGIGMLTVAIGAVLNLILDPVFIFALDMGVGGAAIATVISQAVSAAWTFFFLIGKRAIYKIKLKRMKLEFRRVKKILVLGLPGFVMALTNSIVQMVCNSTLQTYGGDIYIGIMTIISSVRDVLSMPIMGFTNAAQPIIGYNFGAREYDRVKTTIRYISYIVLTYGVLSWIAVSALPELFIRIFSSDTQTLSVGVGCLHVYFFGFFFMGFQFCGQSVFTAMGMAKKAVFFSLFRKVIIVVPLTLLLPLVWSPQVYGVFAAEPISNLVGGLACFITMYFTVYRKLGKREINI